MWKSDQQRKRVMATLRARGVPVSRVSPRSGWGEPTTGTRVEVGFKSHINQDGPELQKVSRTMRTVLAQLGYSVQEEDWRDPTTVWVTLTAKKKLKKVA